METKRTCGRIICSYIDCPKTFSKPSRLKHHLMTHTKDRPYICDVRSCDKSYTRVAHLKRHKETTHNDTPKTTITLICTQDDCQLSFQSTSSLKKHIKVAHLQEPQYRCREDSCTEAFRKKHQLRAHGYFHKGVLPFQCEEKSCLKRFAQKSHLDHHRKIHQGYSCSVEECTEVFSKFSQLRKHRKVCTKQAEYLCGECGKKFHSASRLTYHGKVHQDTRTLYQCPEDGCPRAYLDKRNLTAHIKSYHENKRYQCEHPDCERSFVTQQKLKHHLKLHDPAHKFSKANKVVNKSGKKKGVVEVLTGVPKKAIEVVDDSMTETSDSDSEADASNDSQMETSCDAANNDNNTNNNVQSYKPNTSPVGNIQDSRLSVLCGEPLRSCTYSQGSKNDVLHKRS